MSCGFELPKVSLPFPKPPRLKLPTIPAVPDFSWAIELGLALTIVLLLFVFPKPPIPRIPKIPLNLDLSWAIELGLEFSVPDLIPPIPKPPIPKIPKVPSFELPPCPFDDEV